MATVTVKNIPEQTYALVKDLAAEHRRSINSEIIYLLENVTKSRRLMPDEYLLIARKLRKKTKSYTISDSEITTLKNEGRP